MSANPTLSLQKASSPAPQKEKPLQYTDDLGSIIARVDAHGTETTKELSDEEKQQRLGCEKMIKESALAGCKSAFMMGCALTMMRDGNLCRDTHESVYAYAKDTYNIKRARVSQLIGFAKVVVEIRTQLLASMPGKTDKEVENLLPCSEVQTRGLNGLNHSEMKEVWAEVIAKKPVNQVTAEYVEEVRKEKFPTKKKERKAKAQESGDPVHLVASVTDGKLDIVTEPAKPQDGFKIELTVKSGSLKETRAALRRLAGKDLTKALKKAA